jgi:glycosyltransferase involved in cell wall biosynthesis
MEPTTKSTQRGDFYPSPVVSIIMPAFRVAKYIGEALDSVLAQTFTDYEIIVVNDVSPDTEELEKVLEDYRGRVIYLKREKNGGPGAARNTGILAARGQFVAFLDADDYWEPAFLTEQLTFMENHPDVGLVYSDASWFLEGSRKVIGTLMTAAPSKGEPTFESLIRQECTVGTSAVLARRQTIFDAGLFDPDIGNYSEDFDLYLRIAKSGARLAYQRKLLVHHRVHPESLTSDPLQLPQGFLRVLRKMSELEGITSAQQSLIARTSAKIQADLDLHRARIALARGEFAEARRAVGLAHGFYHSWKLKFIMLSLLIFPSFVSRMYKLRRA